MATIAGAGIAMAAKNAQHAPLWMDISLCALMLIGSVLVISDSFKDILKNILWMWFIMPISLLALALGVTYLWRLIM